MFKTKLAITLAIFVLIFSCGSGDDQPSNSLSINMIDSASERIKSINPDAIIIFVSGSSFEMPTLNNPTQTSDWYFLADTTNNDNGDEAWEIHFDGVWEITEISQDIPGFVYGFLYVKTMVFFMGMPL